MSAIPPKNRAIIYTRVSTEEQKDLGNSLPSQIRNLREKMQREGVKEVHEPIEDVESGRNSERKGIKKVIELAEKHMFDLLCVWDLDRLGRDVAETPYLMHKLKENGVIVRDRQTEYNFNEPLEYLLVVMRCYQGHSESIKIGERTQRGKVEKFLQGKWVGPTPFGCRKNENGVLEKLSEFEPIIIEFFQTLLQVGDYKKATQCINRKYAETIVGKNPPFPLTTARFAAIVRNPIYSGQAKYGNTLRDSPNLTVVPKVLWDRVQQLSETKARKNKKKETKKVPAIWENAESLYGMDYLLRFWKKLTVICDWCGSPTQRFGSKLYEYEGEKVRLPNFRCKKEGCNHEFTVPSIREYKELKKEKVSCPKCGVADDFERTEALDQSIVYTCNRCGAYFSMINSTTTKRLGEKGNQKAQIDLSSVANQEVDNSCVLNPFGPRADEKQNTNKKRLRPRQLSKSRKENRLGIKPNLKLSEFFADLSEEDFESTVSETRADDTNHQLHGK
jgi:DNA invertase Pin-like site-specific DNA recombinase